MGFQLEKDWGNSRLRFLSCRSSSVLLASISCGCSSDLSAFFLSAKYEQDEELEFWSCMPKTCKDLLPSAQIHHLPRLWPLSLFTSPNRSNPLCLIHLLGNPGASSHHLDLSLFCHLHPRVVSVHTTSGCNLSTASLSSDQTAIFGRTMSISAQGRTTSTWSQAV